MQALHDGIAEAPEKDDCDGEYCEFAQILLEAEHEGSIPKGDREDCDSEDCELAQVDAGKEAFWRRFFQTISKLGG